MGAAAIQSFDTALLGLRKNAELTAASKIEGPHVKLSAFGLGSFVVFDSSK